ncbi:DnaB-like helicase C-terminal domain-containing protein [Tepidibacillus fermentans]|uniref:Replicative DNA helicase n=1 Tax=Tepidibacillus fermentans TaxID=1281767 RepID=A0A4R3KKF9_9BACI|nr:DnaB-like helicase C-terminal domain-containing protein [Tepidibacillus fermentans]TCS84117.1 replicative DNA helicase [Tepidibacillus fermentans]
MEDANKKIQRLISEEEMLRLVKYYQEQLTEDALLYLKGRGIEQDIIEKFSIGFEKDTIGFQPYHQDFKGYFRNRIVFPLYTKDKKVIDFIGRSLDGREPKYKSLLGVEDHFFNEAVLEKSQDVIFCNSIFDVLSLEQVNLPAICMVDNQVYNEQIGKIKGKRVFFCFGNDELGRRESIRLAKIFESHVKELYIIRLPQGFKDINDFFVRVKDPVDQFIKLIHLTLEESIYRTIAPEQKNLIIYQEEYNKRHKGNVTGIKTGFQDLDSLLMGGLQEGLYVLGGNVSVGKTTFLKQLTDQIARHVPVIYISWDMTSFELWARTMARLSKHPVQAVLSGSVPIKDIQLANQKYADIAKRIWIVEATLSSGLEDIAFYISKILQGLNTKPVIIFDHLQRIQVSKGTSLTNTEQQLQVTHHLNSLSRTWGLPIILAASETEEDLPSGLLASVDVYLSLEEHSKDQKIPVTLELRKNRNGALGKVQFLFDRAIGEFSKVPEYTD